MATYYVYCFQDGAEILYIGKGKGNRLARQQKRFGVPGVILEYVEKEEDAYKREIYWIDRLKPTLNKNAGGGGSLSDPDPIPTNFRGHLSLNEWRASQREGKKQEAEMQRVGSRRYTARMLLRKLNEYNCSQFGLSKTDMFRIAEVANGPWC